MGPINVDHDRRTRMIDSSVKASMKKGGGGGFNWGNDMDMDFEPVAADSGPKVSVAPAEAALRKKSWSPRRYTNNMKKFPELTPGAVPAERAAPVWGPGMNPKPAPPAARERTDSCRSGSITFDAQRPRNQFAPRPRRTQSMSRSRTSTSESMGVDEKEKEHQATPLSILKSQPDHKKPVQIKPKLQKNSMSRKPPCTKRPAVTQARAR